MCYRLDMEQAAYPGRGPGGTRRRLPFRLPCLAGLLALASGCAGIDAPPPDPPGTVAPLHRESHDGLVVPRTGVTVPALNLVDQRGQPFDPDRLLGRWTLLIFGYTHCPDYCPATLLTLSRALRAFEREDPTLSGRLQVVLVSVDPFRDTPDVLAGYISYFNPGFLAATGTPADLKRLALQLGANYSYTDTASGRLIHDVGRQPARNYAVNHDAGLFVFDGRARFFERLDPPLDNERLAALLARIRAHDTSGR
ncbi:MAG: SCO family protein [Gammaproteobacteria bacterium]|nr:SCO family protein [Gammaproteobacteria bacterium]